MGSYKMDLNNQTATSINGITFKLTETEQGEIESVCLNPKDIPPDDLNDDILGKMVKEADAMYQWQLRILKQ
jgi:hypothetical protein